MTGSAITLTTLIENVTTLVGGVIDWMGQIVTFVGSQPLVMTFVTISLVGLGVGMLSRVLNLRG